MLRKTNDEARKTQGGYFPRELYAYLKQATLKEVDLYNELSNVLETMDLENEKHNIFVSILGEALGLGAEGATGHFYRTFYLYIERAFKYSEVPNLYYERAIDLPDIEAAMGLAQIAQIEGLLNQFEGEQIRDLVKRQAEEQYLIFADPHHFARQKYTQAEYKIMKINTPPPQGLVWRDENQNEN